MEQRQIAEYLVTSFAHRHILPTHLRICSLHTHTHHPSRRKKKLVIFLVDFELYHISNTRTVKVSFQGGKKIIKYQLFTAVHLSPTPCQFPQMRDYYYYYFCFIIIIIIFYYYFLLSRNV